MTERDKLQGDYEHEHDREREHEEMELDSINNGVLNNSDPTDKFWTFYLNQTSKADRDMVEDWKGTTDGILIFAGLFSGVITSFIVESYKSLQPQIDELTLRAIAQISLQLAAANGTGDSVPSYTLPDLNDYKPTKTATWVNIFWFTSLFFSLSCALTATLVQQWSREYIQSIERYQVPRQRGQVRAHLFQGLTIYKMSGFMDAIPALLHISLFTFFAGLFMLIHPINTTVGIVLFGLFLFGSLLYFLTSLIALYYHSYPFSTPLSQWFLRLAKMWRLKSHTGKLSRLREAAAETNESALLEAYTYVLAVANEDREFEELLDVLPDFYVAQQKSPQTLTNLLGEFYRNQGFRIRQVLDDAKALPGKARDRKVLSCLNFMYTLTRLTVNPSASRIITETLADWAFICFNSYLDDPNQYISNIAFAVAAHATSCTKDRMLINPISTESDLTMSQVVEILQPIRDYQLASLIEDDYKRAASTRPFGYIISCFERYPRLRNLCPQVYSLLIKAERRNLDETFVEVADVFLTEIYKGQITPGIRDVLDIIYTFLCNLDSKPALTTSLDLISKFKDTRPQDRRIASALAKCELRLDLLAHKPRRDQNVTGDSSMTMMTQPSPPRDDLHGGYSKASGFGANANNRPIQGLHKYHLSDEPVLTVMSPTTISAPSSAGILGQFQAPLTPSPPRMGHSHGQHSPSQHTSPIPPLRLQLPPGASSPNQPGTHSTLPPGSSPAQPSGSPYTQPWDVRGNATPLTSVASGSSSRSSQPQHSASTDSNATLSAHPADDSHIHRPSPNVSYAAGYNYVGYGRRHDDDDDSDNERDHGGNRPTPTSRTGTPRPAPHRRDRTDYDEFSRLVD